MFTHDLFRRSKKTNVFSKIIITKAKLQAISDAIAIYNEEALKNSEIWLYINSQMTLQRLNSKSNVNSRLFNDIHQNLIDLRQKQCQIRIQWVLSYKNIIENEKANELVKIAAQELSAVNNTKIIIISFVKKQICKETEVQWLNTWNVSIKKENQYWKHTSEVNLSNNNNNSYALVTLIRSNHEKYLCYVCWVNKILWGRKSLAIYTAASRSQNNMIETMYWICS